MPRIKMVCSHCGGTNVQADAYVTWSVTAQQWEISNVFDKGHYCDDCDGECSLEEAPADAQARAAEYGYYVGHDLNGWYVATEEERERDEAGPSVGFDGRPHYATEDEAADAIEAEEDMKD